MVAGGCATEAFGHTLVHTQQEHAKARGMAQDLDDACIVALHKAKQIHDVLYPLIKASNAVESAYTFKGRVKPWHAVRDKVLRKRHEGRRDYSPDNLKDASGFRIVSLFNSDIPKALDHFLELAAAGSETSVLRLACISEIEIHSNRKEGDPLSIVESVRQVLGARGLLALLETKKTDHNFSNYSSVHVIVSCAFAEGGRTFTVNSEVQFRSLFEEAWSEISHKLGYGPDKEAKAKLGIDKSISDPLPHWKLHLDALKSLADGCAQYSDLISKEAGWTLGLNGAKNPPPPKSVETLGGGWREFYAGIDAELFSSLEEAFAERDAAETKANTERRIRPEDRKGAQLFRQAGHKFETILTRLENHVSASEIPSADEEFPSGATPSAKQINGVRAETAYCFMYSGNAELLKASERLWRKVLEVEEDFPPALHRLAQVRLRSGDPDEARVLLERAEQKLDIASHESTQHTQRLWVIRRDLGIVYWRLSERQESLGEKINLLSLSMEVSSRALEISSDETHKRIVASSGVYCAAELFKIDEQNREKISETGKRLLDALKGLSAYGNWDNEDVWTIMSLDSMLRAELEFGSVDTSSNIIDLVISKLDQRIEAKRKIGWDQRRAFDSLSEDEQDIYLNAVAARDRIRQGLIAKK